VNPSNDYLVQSRKQKLQDERLVRLFVAEDQIDHRRISLNKRMTHYGQREGRPEGSPGLFGVGNGLLEIQFAGGWKSIIIAAGMNTIYALWQFNEPFFDLARPLWR
jgi:hypothetical protein